MPRNLTYIICALAVAALVTGVYFVRDMQRSAMTRSDTPLVFPDLRAVLNEVTRIEGRSKGGPYTLEHESGAWRLVERGNYPADRATVTRMLLGLAAITSVNEVETRLEKGDADVHYVALKDRLGKTLASALIQELQSVSDAQGTREIHVRTPAESKVWRGVASIPIIVSNSDWLDSELLRIDAGRIAQVMVQHADGEQVRIVRTPGQRRAYALDMSTAEALSDDERAVKNVATGIANLAFDEVYAAADRPLVGDTEVTLELLTYDAMRIDIQLVRVDNTWRAQLRASTQIPAPRLTVRNSDAFEDNAVRQLASSTVRAQIETLNRRWRGYVFELDASRLEAIVVRRAELLSPPSS